MRRFCVSFVLCLIFLLLPNEIKAALDIKIQNISLSSVTTNEQEVTVTASISGLPSASFFRVAWQQNPGSVYYGYVKNNNGDWVKVQTSQDCKNYFSVADTNTNLLTLSTKVGDDNSPENGTHFLKIRRYTSTCGSQTDSEGFPIKINFPTPTPSTAPTNPPTTSPTNIPPPTTSPTVSPTRSPTPKPTKSPTPEPELLGSETESSIGGTIDNLRVSTPQSSALPAESKNALPIIAGAFIFSGIGLIGVAGYIFWKKQKEISSDTINE